MLSFAGSLRIFVALEPCDMRKGFEGLHALASGRLGEEVKSGALFVFTNKRRTRLKVPYWDGTGLWLLTKRLEAGTFSWPRSAEAGAGKLLLKPEAFAMLTDGINLRGADDGALSVPLRPANHRHPRPGQLRPRHDGIPHAAVPQGRGPQDGNHRQVAPRPRRPQVLAEATRL
jgi:transposase